MTYAAWSLFALVALADWVVVWRGDRRAEAVLKPAATLALLAVPVAAVLATHRELVWRAPDQIGDGYLPAGFLVSGWLLVALGFGLLGDVALLSDTVTRFKLGLAAFLVGHLAYVAAFLDAGATLDLFDGFLDTRGPVVALGILLGSVLFTRKVVPNAWRSDGPALALPIFGYTLVIGAMLLAAFATGLGLVALGAAIFVASDSILARDRFVAPLPHGHLMVMVTYHLGQALIVAGLLA